MSEVHEILRQIEERLRAAHEATVRAARMIEAIAPAAIGPIHLAEPPRMLPVSGGWCPRCKGILIGGRAGAPCGTCGRTLLALYVEAPHGS